MAEAVPAAGAPRVSRLDRRKARTRQALIDAAVRLIAEGRGDRASIQEITEEADIGFGSFYNHFDSKEQLFATASEEVPERWGRLIDRATAGITDPAELFAAGTRISGRLTRKARSRRAVGGSVDRVAEPEAKAFGMPAGGNGRARASGMP
jgi:AcrR family transcriptional regulator